MTSCKVEPHLHTFSFHIQLYTWCLFLGIFCKRRWVPTYTNDQHFLKMDKGNKEGTNILQHLILSNLEKKTVDQE